MGWISVHQANPYEDRERAEAYARLGIENTYYLAYRDLPEIFAKYRISGLALDYGWSTSAFPENARARSGDRVRLIIKDLGDRRVVEDTLWTEDAYHETFQRTPLRLRETRKPIVEANDRYACAWISEKTHAPFVMFVLEKPAPAP